MILIESDTTRIVGLNLTPLWFGNLIIYSLKYRKHSNMQHSNSKKIRSSLIQINAFQIGAEIKIDSNEVMKNKIKDLINLYLPLIFSSGMLFPEYYFENAVVIPCFR